MNVHSKPGILSQEWLACFCACLVTTINGNQNVNIFIGLRLSRSSNTVQSISPAKNRDTDCNLRVGHSGRPFRMRSAQNSAK